MALTATGMAIKVIYACLGGEEVLSAFAVHGTEDFGAFAELQGTGLGDCRLTVMLAEAEETKLKATHREGNGLQRHLLLSFAPLFVLLTNFLHVRLFEHAFHLCKQDMYRMARFSIVEYLLFALFDPQCTLIAPRAAPYCEGR